MTIFEKVIREVNKELLEDKKRTRPLVFMAGSDMSSLEGEHIPCNVAAINRDLAGGFKSGNLHLITGNPGSGKTALLSTVMQEGKKRGYIPIYVNLEPGLPESTWLNINVDKGDFNIIAGNTSEEITEAVIKLLTALRDQSEERVIIAFDSINAFTPSNMLKRQDTKGHDSAGMAERARAVSMFLERIAGTNLLASQSMIFIVSQKRVDINSYGAPEKISGGKAVVYMPKTIVDLKGKRVMVKKKIQGAEVNFPVALEVTYLIEKNTAGGRKDENGKVVGNVPTAGQYTYTYSVDGQPGRIDDTLVLFEFAKASGVLMKIKSKFCFKFGDFDITETEITKKEDALKYLGENEVIANKLRELLQNSGPAPEEENISEPDTADSVENINE